MLSAVRITRVIIVFLAGFYLSLIASSRSLTATEHNAVERAITVLESRGFSDDAWVLRTIATFRGPENWLNSFSEGAFAKTNFPFQIITIYPDFLTTPQDDLERAAVLLHEARHLRGSTEAEAYKYVWLNRCALDLTFRGDRPNAMIYAGEYEAKMRNPDLEPTECN